MTKNEFLAALRHALGKLPASEIEQSLAFYEEIIDDRMEEGMSEQEAVEALGPIQPIAEHISAETPVIPRTIAKANTGSRMLNIVLLCVFSPLWVPVVLLIILLVLAIYLGIWYLVVGLWVIVGCLIMSAAVGIISFIWCAAIGHPLTGVFLLGSGLALCGLGLFALFGVFAVSKGLLKATVSFSRWLYGLFKKRRGSTSEHGKPTHPTTHHAPTPPPSYEPADIPTSSIGKKPVSTDKPNAEDPHVQTQKQNSLACRFDADPSETGRDKSAAHDPIRHPETTSKSGKSEGAQSR